MGKLMRTLLNSLFKCWIFQELNIERADNVPWRIWPKVPFVSFCWMDWTMKSASDSMMMYSIPKIQYLKMLKLHSILNKAWQVWHIKLTLYWLIFFCRTVHVKKESFRGWNFKNYFSLTKKRKNFKNYKNFRAIIFFNDDDAFNT